MMKRYLRNFRSAFREAGSVMLSRRAFIFIYLASLAHITIFFTLFPVYSAREYVRTQLHGNLLVFRFIFLWVIFLSVSHVIILFLSLVREPFRIGNSFIEYLKQIFPHLDEYLNCYRTSPQDRGDFWCRMATINSHLKGKFLIVQIAMTLIWIINLFIILSLAVTITMALEIISDGQHCGLTWQQGTIDFLYYTMATFSTIGPGRMYPLLPDAECLVMYMASMAITLITIGASFTINVWY